MALIGVSGDKPQSRAQRHHAFEAEVQHARAFHHHLAQGRQQHRRGRSQHARQNEINGVHGVTLRKKLTLWRMKVSPAR